MFFFCVFLLLLFLFFVLSKFALPGVMLKSERSQYDRKKENIRLLDDTLSSDPV